MSAQRYTAAAAAFCDALEQLDLPTASVGDEQQQSELGRRAAMLATAELQWQQHLGPLLTWQQAADLMQTVGTRQGVNDLARRGRLVALRSRGDQLLYPLFQFKRGRPLPALPDILDAFQAADVDAWTIASWLVSPQELLDGTTPVAWLKDERDPARAVVAAERTAARLEQ